MKVSRTVSYAVGAILQLSRSDKAIAMSSVRLATEGSMPERFLLQILRQLVVHGILRSERGVFGGYVLGRGLSEISLLDVIEAIEGPIEASFPEIASLPSECVLRLQMGMLDIAQENRARLRRMSLGSIADGLPSDATPRQKPAPHCLPTAGTSAPCRVLP